MHNLTFFFFFWIIWNYKCFEKVSLDPWIILKCKLYIIVHPLHKHNFFIFFLFFFTFSFFPVPPSFEWYETRNELRKFLLTSVSFKINRNHLLRDPLFHSIWIVQKNLWQNNIMPGKGSTFYYNSMTTNWVRQKVHTDRHFPACCTLHGEILSAGVLLQSCCLFCTSCLVSLLRLFLFFTDLS